MEIEKLLKVVLFTPGIKGRWGLPILFEGKPGVGKSSMIENNAKLLGLECETLIASIREPTDFGGLPVPVSSPDGNYMEYLAPSWGQSLTINGGNRGLVFLDEVNTCPPSTQSALLRLVLDGALGDYVLPNGIRFLAASNSVADAAGGWDLAPPLANRFGHIQWVTPSVEEWTTWMISGCNTTTFDMIEPEQLESSVMEVWPTAFAKAKGLVSGFLKARPNLFFDMPEIGSANRSKAWPSPRSWEMATRAIAGVAVHNAGELMHDQLIATFVGTGPATEFATYCKKIDLPDPAALLDGEIKFSHDSKRLDITVAVLSSCTALVMANNCENRDNRIDVLWELMTKVGDDAIDIIVPSAAILVKSKKHLQKQEKRYNAKKILRSLSPVLIAGGVRM